MDWYECALKLALQYSSELAKKTKVWVRGNMMINQWDHWGQNDFPTNPYGGFHKWYNGKSTILLIWMRKKGNPISGTSISHICSLYGIFTYIWAIFGVNVSKYAIHGAYMSIWDMSWLNYIIMRQPENGWNLQPAMGKIFPLPDLGWRTPHESKL